MKIPIALALVLFSCRKEPATQEISRLREEARAEDLRLRARDAGAMDPWTVDLRTDIPGVRRAFSMSELIARSTEEMTTVGGAPGTAFGTPHRFRGVRLSRLVEGITPNGAPEVTLLGSDGYFTTLRLEDVQRYPILVAVERDGAPIARNEGGPVMVALPLSVDADIAARYGEDGFCYYLTGIAVGRPRPRMDVNGELREPATLAQAGLVHRKQVVRWRRGWSGDPVDIDGVRLRDVVGTADKPVRVSMFGRRESEAFVVSADEMKTCDPLLVIGPQPTTTPIAPAVGGPILLAPTDACRASWSGRRAWPAFVDSVEVLP